MTVPSPPDPAQPPWGPPPAAVPYPEQPYPPYPGYGPRRTNSLSIASLVCAFLFAPLGIVFGHVSLSQIKRSGEDGRGLAIAGLVLGYLFTVGAVLLVVLGLLLYSVAERVARDTAGSGLPGIPGFDMGGALPVFTPPPGLGSACSYPATPTPAARPARPPRAGAVPTRPAIVAATLVTADGAIGLQLDNAQAPCTVNSFVSLAQQGFFDDTPCHRLADSAALGVLQCGDPTGTGAGGPGYRFANEYPTNQYRPFDTALRRPLTYPRGTLAMANSGPDSNGSQFFLVYRDSLLPPTYTVFGRLDESGLRVLDDLVAGGVRGGGDDGAPADPVTIRSVRLD